MYARHKNEKRRRNLQRKHRDAIPSAKEVIDIARKTEGFCRIILGTITCGIHPLGKRRVKVQKKHSELLLTVRGNTSIQKIAVCAEKGADIQPVMEQIVRGCLDQNFEVRFR